MRYGLLCKFRRVQVGPERFSSLLIEPWLFPAYSTLMTRSQSLHCILHGFVLAGTVQSPD